MSCTWGIMSVSQIFTMSPCKGFCYNKKTKRFLRFPDSTTKQCCKWGHSFPLWQKPAAHTVPDAAGTVWCRVLRTGLYQGLQSRLWCRGSWYTDPTSCEGWRQGPRRRTCRPAGSGQRLQSGSRWCFPWDTQVAPHRSVHSSFVWRQQRLQHKNGVFRNTEKRWSDREFVPTWNAFYCKQRIFCAKW